jgi:hypothetical protein
MKNKSPWSLPPESNNPMQDILDFADTLRNTRTNEVLVFPSFVTKQLEDLQKRWNEKQKK